MKRRLSLRERRAFAQRLRQARAAAGLARDEAARQLRVPVTTLATYEQGRGEVPLSLFADLCRLYRIRLDVLLFGSVRDQEVHQEMRGRLQRVEVLVQQLQRLQASLEVYEDKTREREREAKAAPAASKPPAALIARRAVRDAASAVIARGRPSQRASA